MLATIEGRLAWGRAGELGHIDFLQVLCEDEICRRETTSITRRLRSLEGFDFTASPKLPAAHICDLAASAGCRPGNRSSSTASPASESHVAPASGTSPSATAPTPSSPRPAAPSPAPPSSSSTTW
jgi:hypothetical protein